MKNRWRAYGRLLTAVLCFHTGIPLAQEQNRDFLTPAERAWLAQHDQQILIDKSLENWAPIEGNNQKAP